MDLDMKDDYDAPFRARSNTWPLPRPEIPGSFPGKGELNVDDSCHDISGAGVDLLSGCGVENVIPTVANEITGWSQEESPCGVSGLPGTPSSQPKKNSSRRNAWGNMSYADLITQAIQSSPEKRLTLSQIYDWMVQNVPYFKDKGDSNSSAGWKNSIRHNLSLHNRFKRVQNEGTGKSSWWVINPEAKPGKAARRRATSMETQKYEKKRGRVKKKVEALRNGTLLDNTPSPSSSVSEGLDVFPESPVSLHHGFQLSPDFRPRASSNASSCGRLSPIPVESDMPDSHISPVSPLSAWSSSIYPSDFQEQYTKEIVKMANTMKLGGKSYLNVGKNTGACGTSSPASNLDSVNKSYTNLTTFGTAQLNNTYPTSGGSTLTRNGSDPYFQTAHVDNITLTALNSMNSSPSPSKVLNSDSLGGANNSTYNLTNMSPSLSPSQSLDTLSAQNSINSTTSTFQTSKQSSSQQNGSIVNRGYGSVHDSPAIMRLNNNNKIFNPLNGNTNINNNGPMSMGLDETASSQMSGRNGSSPNDDNRNTSLTNVGTNRIQFVHESVMNQPDWLNKAPASQVMGHLLSLNNPLPNDLDLNLDSLQGGLECDVDQVIRHELSMEGTLDFNFDGVHGSSSSQSVQPSMTNSPQSAASTVSSHSWVH